MAEQPLQIATDGACLSNPGPGGWAWTTETTSACGDKPASTNQEMELRAVLEALRAHPGRPVEVITDSQYAINCLTVWLAGWQRNGWRTASRKPVKHRELIEAIAGEVGTRPVSFTKVRGHAGHVLNEQADRLANAVARRGQAR